MHDQLFASFLLKGDQGLEIALKAENVAEATPLSNTLQYLPASIEYLEGIMSLREDVIPVINLKKRLGLIDHSYSQEAKVAVVSMHNHRIGLLFDDIREVFRTETSNIQPINSLLQTEDKIISSIIKLDNGARTVELLDLGHLFQGGSLETIETMTEQAQAQATVSTTYSRWVVFTCFNQSYGVPVQYAREIAFFSEIDDMFKSGHIEGAIQLRGSTIPVMSGRYLLSGNDQNFSNEVDNRVLILASDECSFGMMVDEIREIITVADNRILQISSGGSENLLGIYPQDQDRDIMLLDMPNLVCNQIDDIKSLAKINGTATEEKEQTDSATRSRHLITENCYLIFAIHKNFAIELKDVQEIIEGEELLTIPRSSGYSNAVINLRGAIVPVINIRRFYGYPESTSNTSKLIICRGQSKTVALEVDQIVTIYKQEDYHSTPSLNPQLAEKKDTLDRLIEYEPEGGLKEHVLVVNLHNLVRNHLEFKKDLSHNSVDTTEIESKTINSEEDSHAS